MKKLLALSIALGLTAQAYSSDLGYFKPENAPTERLRSMTHYWDTEIGLQISKRYLNVSAKDLPDLDSSIAKAIGDEVLSPSFTTQEAQFLLDHRKPIK